MYTPSRELADLLEAACEERLAGGDVARLEELLSGDRAALAYYVRYIQLHGLLHWDAVGGSALSVPEPLTVPPARDRSAPSRRRLVFAVTAAGLCAAIGLMLWQSGRLPGLADQNSIATAESSTGAEMGESAVAVDAPASAGTDGRNSTPPSVVRLTPAPRNPQTVESANPEGAPDAGTAEAIASATPEGRGSSAQMVSVIDRHLEEYWADHGVDPSPVAADAEWLRRVHLDLAGRIPDAEAVTEFLADAAPDRRERVVDNLLDSPDYARHFATVWTNLLIGHTSPREVNREALSKFLRDQFYRNRAWDETITKLVSAEGFDDENGAANFLLAHVNNEAVPATAVTSRVLLCEQVQCTQCHKHPFGDWEQDRFWRLNAFFQQTEIRRHPQTDPATGAATRDRLELVSLPTGGPTFYEDRFAEVQVAYPGFGGVDVDPSESTNRRQELAELLTAGDRPQIARALVNRMWGKFFGYGFTDPIDDMGPHQQPVLPELLDEMSAEFVRGGYDVKQLVRWICLSRAYQLSSATGPGNAIDNPEAGEQPLFSRMYPKPMTAEQLFDSLLAASRADQAGARYWDEVESRRREWLGQFYTALDNDENSEDDSFEGSLTQTLVMMNGDLMQQATSDRSGTMLRQVLARNLSDDERLELLSLATLSRQPTPREAAALKKAVRQRVQARSPGESTEAAQHEAYRDVMWAYLNSSEFRTIH
jgi:hypothetical protein